MGGTVKRNQLDHFVSVESLTNEEVLNLIKRAEEFKNGAIPQMAKPATSYISIEASNRFYKTFFRFVTNDGAARYFY